MTEQQPVLYELGKNVATITLNRPEVYNAFNEDLHRELMAALKQAERDAAARCIVLTGAGKAFCSGQDIKHIPLDDSAGLAEAVRRLYNPLIQRLRSINKPIIAAVNGVAAGAGFSMALACDFRVAVDSARFIAAFANIGLVPDSGMTYFLPRLIGQARALELCMLGEGIDAPTAYSYGMLNRIAAADEFPAAVQELATRLAGASPQALSLIKRAFDFAADAGLEQVLDYEAQAQQVAAANPDFAEGVTAFREKRKPRFGE
jgi:2-(1,2-epoxy-1,2-dihydrophenyl)acetyl-CoA isomerase